MWNSQIKWGLVLVLVMVVFGSRMECQVRTVGTVAATDGGFDSQLSQQYPGLTTHKDFVALRPACTLLNNPSSHAIRAFTVKWTITRQDGTIDTRFVDFMGEPSDFGPLNVGLSDPRKKVMSGNKKVLDVGETRLVTPFFNLGKKQYAASTTSTAAIDTLLKAYSGSPQLKEFDEAKNVVSSIDGIVYDDNTFVGNDESKLWRRYEWERNGQHDEGISMLKWMASGATDADLVARLNEHINKGRTAKGSTQRDFWLAARGREAQRLLMVFKQGGRSDLQTVSKLLANSKKTVLHQ